MSFSSFINKGSSFFAGRGQDNETSPSATNFFKDDVTPYSLALVDSVWTQVNAGLSYSLILPSSQFTHHISPDVRITYNGDFALHSINYCVSSLLNSTNHEVTYAIYVNNGIVVSSTQILGMAQEYISCTGLGMIELDTGDEIRLKVKIDGGNDTIEIQNIGIVVFQVK